MNLKTIFTYLVCFLLAGCSAPLTLIEILKGCPEGYSKGFTGIYHQSGCVTGICCKCKLKTPDSKTFKILDSKRAIDRNQFWYGCTPSPGIDYETFELVDKSPYAKDKNSIYVFSTSRLIKKINGVSPRNFHYFGELFIRSESNVYFNIGYTDRAVKVPLADSSTFQIVERYYAKDKNRVWYTDPQQPDREPVRELKGADPKTFKAASEYYGFDKKNVWHYSTLISSPRQEVNEFYSDVSGKSSLVREIKNFRAVDRASFKDLGNGKAQDKFGTISFGIPN